MKIFITSLLLLLSIQAFTQTDNPKLDSIINKALNDVDLESVVVVYRTPKEIAKLHRDVGKAYPYALRVASVINQIETHKNTIKKKKNKRRYLKKKEKLLKKEFADKLKNLTKTQGRYMVRLINRETDNTVYNIIKEYKSGTSAVLWQAIAKKFDSDLKSTYDPENMESIDYEIEYIVEKYSEKYKNRIKNEIVIKAPTYRDFQ